MSRITRVALVGATGNLGPAILGQLLSAGFEVTVLTRSNSTHSFPPSVAAIAVDYDSLSGLISAFQGQDAVVSTIASTALSKQLLLVEAAAKARVKRFIPSEFGSNTLHEKTLALPVFADKVAVQHALKAEAASGSGMSYTIICNGPFFDWGMQVGFVMSIGDRRITLYDGGDRVFSTTTLSTIGKAVVGVLLHPDQTKNRAVYVQDTATTLKKLSAVAKKVTGGDDWNESVESIEDILSQAWAELQKEKPDPSFFVLNFIKASIWGDGYGSHFEKLDNELLGIKEMDDSEIQGLIETLAK